MSDIDALPDLTDPNDDDEENIVKVDETFEIDISPIVARIEDLGMRLEAMATQFEIQLAGIAHMVEQLLLDKKMHIAAGHYGVLFNQAMAKTKGANWPFHSVFPYCQGEEVVNESGHSLFYVGSGDIVPDTYIITRAEKFPGFKRTATEIEQWLASQNEEEDAGF